MVNGPDETNQAASTPDERPEVGQWVEYLGSDDPDPFPPAVGAHGVVVFVDDAGTRHVRWQDGRHLGLLPRVDRWVIVHPAPVV